MVHFSFQFTGASECQQKHPSDLDPRPLTASLPQDSRLNHSPKKVFSEGAMGERARIGGGMNDGRHKQRESEEGAMESSRVYYSDIYLPLKSLGNSPASGGGVKGG